MEILPRIYDEASDQMSFKKQILLKILISDSQLCRHDYESKSKQGTEETIEYLEKKAKRDMNSEEKNKLGEPEGQFEKIRIKRQPDGAINICTTIAISYRYQPGARSQEWDGSGYSRSES